MLKINREGHLVCNVCERDYWFDHTTGGNCVNPPVRPSEPKLLESEAHDAR